MGSTESPRTKSSGAIGWMRIPGDRGQGISDFVGQGWNTWLTASQVTSWWAS